MGRLATLLLLLLPPLLWAADSAPEVVVYAYDSYGGEGSLGEHVQTLFAKQGGRSRLVLFPNSGEMLNQLALEGTKTSADVVLGVDDSLLGRAKDLKLFAAQPKTAASGLAPELLFDTDLQFLPYDYGYIAVLYHEGMYQPRPGITFEEFFREKGFDRSLALQDPRTSSTGLSFMIWMRQVVGTDGLKAFWPLLSKKIRTVAPGWSGSYGLFLKKGAKFVVSYTTSPAYHLEKEKNATIRAVPFSDGHYRQVEGVSLVASSKHTPWARKYIDLLLSEEVQRALPLKQWMYPARRGVALPASFTQLPPVPKSIPADPLAIHQNKAQWLREWTAALSGMNR